MRRDIGTESFVVQRSDKLCCDRQCR